jgi:hypothetical protein
MPMWLQHDEWVVCRVFQKMAGNKKLFMYADMPYQVTDSHSALPGPQHRDSSPNPTVTDDGDCDTCTGNNESCYNCRDGVAMASPGAWVQAADMSTLNPYYPSTVALMAQQPQPQPQRGYLPVTPVKAYDRHRATRATKVEPFYQSGEDEAQSSLGYAWPGDSVLYQESAFPCDSPLPPGESAQSSCLTDPDDHQARLLSRALRGFSQLPEMAGPIDNLQELGWAY